MFITSMSGAKQYKIVLTMKIKVVHVSYLIITATYLLVTFSMPLLASKITLLLWCPMTDMYILLLLSLQ